MGVGYLVLELVLVVGCSSSGFSLNANQVAWGLDTAVLWKI